MTAFADTGYYVALLNPRDQLHSIAVEASLDYRGRVFTTEFVLIELGNFLGTIARDAFCDFYQQLRTDSACEILPSSSLLFRQAMDLYSSRGDKGWSVTDCSSFVVMRQYNLIDALTFDRHFEQAGFRSLLR